MSAPESAVPGICWICGEKCNKPTAKQHKKCKKRLKKEGTFSKRKQEYEKKAKKAKRKREEDVAQKPKVVKKVKKDAEATKGQNGAGSAIQAKAPSSGGINSDTFYIDYYNEIAHCLVEDEGKFRDATVYQAKDQSRVVIWYGGSEYEGLWPAPAYSVKDLPTDGSKWTGAPPGKILDNDGDLIKTKPLS